MLLHRLGHQPRHAGSQPARRDRLARSLAGLPARHLTVAAATVLALVGAVPVLAPPPFTTGQLDLQTTLAQVGLTLIAAGAWWRWRGHHDQAPAPLLAAFSLLLALNYATGAAARLSGLAWLDLIMAGLAASAHLTMLAALLQLSRRGQSLPGWIELTQATALLAMVIAVIWTILPDPAMATAWTPRRPWLYVTIGFNLLGLVMAWSALFRQRRSALPGVGLICLAEAVMAATSTLLLLQVRSGTYQPVNTLDLGWLAAGWLLVAAAAARHHPSPGWLRARQRMVLVGSLLLMVAALVFSVTSVVQDATVRLAAQQEATATLRHAAGEVTRMQALEAQHPMDNEEVEQVLRASSRARLDLNDALTHTDQLPPDDPLRPRLQNLPALLGAYEADLVGSHQIQPPPSRTRASGQALVTAMEQVTAELHARSAAGVAELGRRAAVAQIGVPLGLLVLGLTFASSWIMLSRRERALRRADAWQALTREVVRAQERERSRIAADLHDGPLQAVAAWRIKVEMIGRRMESDPGTARTLLHELDQEVAAQALELRRVMQALRPPVLDEVGFGAAVRQLAEEAADRGGFGVRVDTSGLGRLQCDREIETLAYRILQEVLTNVAKHADASRATVELRAEAGGVHLYVADDGRGMRPFDPDQLVREAHFGLAGVTERVELVGGRLEVSSEPQQGTTVEAWLPAQLQEPADPARAEAGAEGE